ncbi:hypothetical protein [uncultured Alsobacter sp.]|uniref:hypothetical protein n=1 Tax=uncultured Alsobacter sp. TaxID=1748258 RepID=UPI0025E91F1C|nr:hypothetical protein [uncultured Alsobacter sp.]
MNKLSPEPEKQVHKDHTVIVPPNTLRAKALVRAKNGQQDIDEMIKRADRALEALAPSFAEWMGNEIHRLFEAISTFEASDRGPEAAKSFFIVVHDVRGQALQFGYPIAAQLAGGLCDLLERQEDIGLPPVIMRRYVEAIASIVRSGIRDEANALAVELARTLAKVVADYRARLAEGKIAPGRG